PAPWLASRPHHRRSYRNRDKRSLRPRGFLFDGPFHSYAQFARSLAMQGDFRAIHLKHARIAPRRAQSRGDARPRKEAQLHRAACVVAREIDAVEDAGIAFAQIEERGQRRLYRSAVATQLQHSFSMLLSEILVKRLTFPFPGFFGHRSGGASKCAK